MTSLLPSVGSFTPILLVEQYLMYHLVRIITSHLANLLCYSGCSGQSGGAGGELLQLRDRRETKGLHPLG